MMVEARANLPGFGMVLGDHRELDERDPEVRRALELGSLHQVGGGRYDTVVAREAQQGAARRGCGGCGG